MSWQRGRRPRILWVCERAHPLTVKRSPVCMCRSADTYSSHYQRERETEREERKGKRAHQAVSVSVWLCPETRGLRGFCKSRETPQQSLSLLSFIIPDSFLLLPFPLLSPPLEPSLVSLPLRLSPSQQSVSPLSPFTSAHTHSYTHTHTHTHTHTPLQILKMFFVLLHFQRRCTIWHHLLIISVETKGRWYCIS